jgi:hypothetical protein
MCNQPSPLCTRTPLTKHTPLVLRGLRETTKLTFGTPTPCYPGGKLVLSWASVRYNGSGMHAETNATTEINTKHKQYKDKTRHESEQ